MANCLDDRVSVDGQLTDNLFFRGVGMPRIDSDLSKCLACGACIVACSRQKNQPPTVRFRYLMANFSLGADNSPLYHFVCCLHCSDPACLNVCPSGVYYIYKGMILRHEKQCRHCGLCVKVCPQGAIQSYRGHTLGKCDMCHGQDPACITACPQNALSVID